jgi:hypothetical protein
VTIEDGQSEPTTETCPNCGSDSGIQTFVPIWDRSGAVESYIPSYIECHAPECLALLPGHATKWIAAPHVYPDNAARIAELEEALRLIAPRDCGVHRTNTGCTRNPDDLASCCAACIATYTLRDTKDADADTPYSRRSCNPNSPCWQRDAFPRAMWCDTCIAADTPPTSKDDDMASTETGKEPTIEEVRAYVAEELRRLEEMAEYGALNDYGRDGLAEIKAILKFLSPKPLSVRETAKTAYARWCDTPSGDRVNTADEYIVNALRKAGTITEDES